MAAAEKADKQDKGASLAVQVGLLLALSAAAAGAGWFSGGILAADGAPAPKTEEEDGHGAGTKETHVGELTPNIVHIDTITTNLASPSDVWVRLEVALVFEKDPDPLIAENIHQDFLSFLRTVKLYQIEGASGFQHLKADLEERARIRSEDKVNQILVRTLLFE